MSASRRLPLVSTSEALACPSAPADIPGAVAFGVIDHTSSPAEVMYLEEALPVTDELLALAAPLEPREIFRFGAPCQTSRCSHWSGHECNLVNRIVDLVPAASIATPPCTLRASCRWYAQAGRSACLRCVHVVTKDEQPDDAMRTAASPAKAPVAMP
jgi:hypothetical protein